MYPLPRDIPTRVFTRLPERLRVNGRSNRWVDVQRGGTPTHSFLEGPAFDRDGNLFVVDIPWGRIFRISRDGEIELFTEYDGEPNGIAIHRDGRLFVADFRHGIMTVDPRTREVEPWLTRSTLDRFKGVNDLTFSDDGDLYFTDQGMTGMHEPRGCLYRQRPDGRLERLLSNIPSPNGLAVAPGGKVVYVNATRGNSVWRVPLDAGGMPFKVGVFIQLSGGLAGPDGMALDADGNLAIAHAGLGTVWLFSRLGEPIARIRSCEGLAVSNVAYDRHRLYITEGDSGCVLVAELDVPGLALYSHKAG